MTRGFTFKLTGSPLAGLSILALLAAVMACAEESPFTALPEVRELDPQALVIAAQTITTNQYPDADSVLVDCVVRQSYQPDGTGVEESDEFFKVLSEKGRRDAVTQRYYFSLPYSTVTVVRAVIYKADGAALTTDVARASRVMVNPGQMSANIYDPNSKILSLSLAGVEVGDMVRCTVRQQVMKARVPNMWADYNVFEYDVPIRRMSYAVASPSALPLRHVELRDPVGQTISHQRESLNDGRELNLWEVRDVPRYFSEPNMPPMHTVVQRLLLSTAADWPALSRWYWELCQPRLAAVTPEMRTLSAELAATAANHDDKVRRIFTWVSQNIRYMGITTETEAPGYEPHDVSMTFSNRYGVCRDKAALLVAMLRLADIEAYPVLIHAGAKLDPDVPMTFFNHAIVAAAKEDGSGYELMDPTDEQARELLPGYLDNRSFLVAHPKGETLRLSPVRPAAENLLKISSHGEVDGSGQLTLQSDIEFAGINDNVYRGYLTRQTPELRRQFFEGLVKARVAGAELLECTLKPDDMQNTDEPLHATLRYRAPGFMVEGQDLTLLAPPFLSNAIGYSNFLLGQTGLKERRFPLEVETPCGVAEELELDLRAAVGTLIALPQTREIERAGIGYKRQIAFSNGLLRASTSFLLERPSYPPSDYASLKELLREREYATRERAQFAHGGEGDLPDSRILESYERIELLSPHEWQSSSRTARQILTYAGKKRHSELRLNYNPSWQSAEIVEATVTNSNGEAHFIKPEEINLMDAAWAGGAPRYPAGKTLVVSLPGVESGCTTVVTRRRTQRDAPFFSLYHPFYSHEPIARATLEIVAPLALSLRLSQPGGAVEYSCYTNGTLVTHRWQAENLEAVRREDSLPPWHGFRPTLLASTGAWSDYGKLLEHEIKRAMGESGEAAKLARTLTRSANDPAAKARILRDFVMRAIRKAGPTLDKLPLHFSDADTTLRDGYGHEMDRAILLAAMLRAAGLQADPLLVDGQNRRSALTEPLLAYPQRDLFGGALVAVRPRAALPTRLLRPNATARRSLLGEGLPLYLNDGDQYAELGATAFEGHTLLNLDGTLQSLELPRSLRSRQDRESVITLDAEGNALVAITNLYYGAQCGEFRRSFSEMTPELRERQMQELMGAISQAAEQSAPPLIDLAGYPARLGYQARVPRYAAHQGNRLTLTLPESPAPLWRARADRRYEPLNLNKAGENNWRCSVVLPAQTCATPLLPTTVDWQLPAGMGRFTATTRTKHLPDGAIVVELNRTLRSEVTLLPSELYPALLEMNRRLAHPAMSTVAALLEE